MWVYICCVLVTALYGLGHGMDGQNAEGTNSTLEENICPEELGKN